jgi:hypothetical protein
MNFKHILLITAVAIILSGCGNKNDTTTLKEQASTNPYSWVESHVTAPRFDYIFGGTLVITPPPRNVLGQGLLYEGIVSNTFKKTLHKIWTSLSEKGFSGKEFNFSLAHQAEVLLIIQTSLVQQEKGTLLRELLNLI